MSTEGEWPPQGITPFQVSAFIAEFWMDYFGVQFMVALTIKEHETRNIIYLCILKLSGNECTRIRHVIVSVTIPATWNYRPKMTKCSNEHNYNISLYNSDLEGTWARYRMHRVKSALDIRGRIGASERIFKERSEWIMIFSTSGWRGSEELTGSLSEPFARMAKNLFVSERMETSGTNFMPSATLLLRGLGRLLYYYSLIGTDCSGDNV